MGKYSKYFREARDKGLCGYCKKVPSGNYAACENCRQYLRDEQKKWRLKNPEKARLQRERSRIRNKYKIEIDEYREYIRGS